MGAASLKKPAPSADFDASRLEQLISGHFNCVLTVAEQEELDRLLATSSKARAIYREYAAVEAALHWNLRGNAYAATTNVQPTALGRIPLTSMLWTSHAFFAAVLLAGVALGSIVTWQIVSRRQVDATLAANNNDPEGGLATALSPQVATLISASNCRWDTTAGAADLQRGSALRPGEALHLLEGIAEVESSQAGGGTTKLQLEGPLALTFTNRGIPNLFYGKVTAVFSSDYDQFALDTPLGRITVSGDASIGVMAAANDVEVHVFSGSATLKLWTMGLDKATDQLTASSGSSIRASVERTGGVTIDRGKSRENWFVTPAAIAESQLEISQQYVAAIRRANPLAYWRFEQCTSGMLPNEMSDHLHLRMVGDAVLWRPGGQASTVEFGANAGPGYLISDDTVGTDLAENYTLELWAKPTYYHHGTLFSLIDWTPSQSPLGTHRMALEICGPVSGFTSPYRSTDATPGRIRFIHEVRKNFDAECFSPAPYAVRKWQHFAAVKDESAMRLFVDGKLVRAEQAVGTLATGLRVLMGQLLPVSPEIEDEVTSRLFGGELDEVALYNRALSEAELKEHVELVFGHLRHKSTNPNSDRPPLAEDSTPSKTH
jgi:hypothetical protein